MTNSQICTDQVPFHHVFPFCFDMWSDKTTTRIILQFKSLTLNTCLVTCTPAVCAATLICLLYMHAATHGDTQKKFGSWHLQWQPIIRCYARDELRNVSGRCGEPEPGFRYFPSCFFSNWLWLTSLELTGLEREEGMCWGGTIVIQTQCHHTHKPTKNTTAIPQLLLTFTGMQIGHAGWFTFQSEEAAALPLCGPWAARTSRSGTVSVGQWKCKRSSRYTVNKQVKKSITLCLRSACYIYTRACCYALQGNGDVYHVAAAQLKVLYEYKCCSFLKTQPSNYSCYVYCCCHSY